MSDPQLLHSGAVDEPTATSDGVVRVAAASTISAAVIAALPPAPSTAQSPLILVDRHRSSPAVIAAYHAVRQHWPLVQSAPMASGPTVTVSLAAGADRFAGATIPAWAATGPLALAVHGPSRHHQVSPVAVLAGLADRRQRLAAQVTGDLGAAAELASAWRVALVIIPGLHAGQRFAVVVSTLLAAELVWWALRHGTSDSIGPWEQPSVQRLTSLGLQPAAPTYVRLDPVNIAAGRLVHELWPRLGV